MSDEKMTSSQWQSEIITELNSMKYKPVGDVSIPVIKELRPTITEISRVEFFCGHPPPKEDLEQEKK